MGDSLLQANETRNPSGRRARVNTMAKEKIVHYQGCRYAKPNEQSTNVYVHEYAISW